MIYHLSIAVHTFASRILMSSSEDETLHRTLSTSFIEPLLMWRCPHFWVKHMYFVLFYNFGMIFYFNHFSLIIFYHSVLLGFELFGLRIQVCCQLVQFTLVREGYDNHHCHNKLQTENEAGEWVTSCPEEMDWEFGISWKRFSWGPTMVLRSLGPTMMLRSWGPTMVLRSWGLTMVLRSWSPTMQLRIWDWTMLSDHWASAIGAENWVLCHWVECPTVAAAVKFFGSRPAKMNWDLKHHEICRTLGVLLA